MKKHVYFFSVTLITFILSGCGHEHSYADATCIAPKTCTECGETEGEALGHIFLKATCDTPETCERCGETKGNALGHNFLEATCETPQICDRCNFVGQEALGHTSEVGKCDRCGLYQGKEIIKSILEKLKYADSLTELAVLAQTSSSSANYNTLLSGLTYYESAKIEYESALELCGDYPDLAALKKDIANLIDSLPLNITGSTREALLSYLDDLKNFVIVQAKCQLTAISVKDLLNN